MRILVLTVLCLFLGVYPALGVGRQEKIRVEMFLDKGAHPSSQLIDTFASDRSVSLAVITGEDIRNGCLKDADVLFMPGGSGKKEAFSIGEEGKNEIRQFTKDGGIYIGVCAGCYLATWAHPEYLGLLPLTTVDKNHWRRGKATLPIQFTPLGMEIFGVNQANANVIYHNGPVLQPLNNEASKVAPLSYYRDEIVAPRGRAGVMVNSPAMVLSRCGKGLVLGISPHPEVSRGLTKIELNAVHWLYNNLHNTKYIASAKRTVSVNSSLRAVSPNALSEQIYNKAEEIFERTTKSHYQHLHERVEEQVQNVGGAYQTTTDCSGFINYIINSVAPKQCDIVLEMTGRSYPHAKTYATFIRQLNTSTNGWLKITNFRDLRRGDIIAWGRRQDNSLPKKTHVGSGHIMIVIDPPGKIIADTLGGKTIRYVPVNVLDSSSVEHFAPQILPPLAHQNHRDGLGKGYIRLMINNQDNVIGFWEGIYSHEKNKFINGPTYSDKIGFARLIPVVQ